MNEINLQLTIREEYALLFKRCVRKLLEGTFLLRDKDARLYAFASREANRQDLSVYLRAMGFDLHVDDKIGLAMLVANEEDENEVGLKQANVVRFSTLQYHLLLVLWKIYLENVGYSERITAAKGDIIDKIKFFGVPVISTELRVAFKLFKKYNLIDFDEDDDSEEQEITLYPSLQFSWDLAQFKTTAQEYMKEPAAADAEEEEERG